MYFIHRSAITLTFDLETLSRSLQVHPSPKCTLIVKYEPEQTKRENNAQDNLYIGQLDGWMDGWVGGWMDG